jgi:hypothetical protein
LKANRFKRKRRPSDPPGTKRVRYRDDPGGSGREIARELVKITIRGETNAARQSRWRLDPAGGAFRSRAA